jgi:hypothetical protein
VTSTEANDLAYPCHLDWKVEIEDVQVTSMLNGKLVSAALRIRGTLRRLPISKKKLAEASSIKKENRLPFEEMIRQY